MTRTAHTDCPASTQESRANNAATAAVASMQEDTLLPVKSVAPIVGLQKSAIHARIRAGTFPKPVRLSSRCTRWRAGDIRAWLAQQAAAAHAEVRA